MKPMKNLLLMGLLSALGAGGALAAERSHFEHFITRDGAALKDGDKVFRFAGIHAPDAVAQVRDEVAMGHPEPATAKRVIGRGYDELALEVVSGWGLPPRIQQAPHPFPPRPVAAGRWFRARRASSRDRSRRPLPSRRPVRSA